MSYLNLLKKNQRYFYLILKSLTVFFIMKIKIKKLKENVKLPKYHHPGDVGMDLYAMEDVIVVPGAHVWIYHGFALEFSEGYAGIVMDKGSISKADLHTMGGVFDAGFCGEYNTHLVNLGDKSYTIE